MEIKLAVLLLLMVVACHAQNRSELLVPNYDNVEHRIKGFHIRQPLVLHCNVTREGDHELIWEKHGKDVSDVDSLDGRYRILEAEHKFIIERTEEHDAGHYSCRLGDNKKEFRVIASIAVRTPANVGVSENEPLAITCTVIGTKPKIYWQIGNFTIHNSTDKYILDENDDIENAVLRMRNVSLDDRGDYTCVAGNILTELNITEEARDVTFLRVKSKMAPLWPAFGICVEILILGLTTVIFSRLDKNASYDDADDDE